MTDIVPAEKIEQIVGAPRHPYKHIARAVSAEQRVYILHSAACRKGLEDLRRCIYSAALDRGIDMQRWAESQDGPWYVGVDTSHQLVPLAPVIIAAS